MLLKVVALSLNYIIKNYHTIKLLHYLFSLSCTVNFKQYNPVLYRLVKKKMNIVSGTLEHAVCSRFAHLLGYQNKNFCLEICFLIY